jgi:SAM-dependent methyltransferase
MLAAARARVETASVTLDLVHGRAEALPFPDGAFNRVVAVTVLCFVHEPDRAIAEMARVLKPGGRLVIGELGRLSLWAVIRRIRGWLGAPTWKAARFRTAGELRGLLERHGLAVRETRGSVYYPPCGFGASLLAPIDPWLGRRTTLGAAFIALSAARPIPHTDTGKPAARRR